MKYLSEYKYHRYYLNKDKYYLKYFENIDEVDPFDEEDWDEQEPVTDSVIGIKNI